MRDGQDVLALLDDRRDERSAELFADPVDVDRPDTRDLAHLTRNQLAGFQCLFAHHDVNCHVGPLAGAIEDEPGDRISCVRIVRFVVGPGLVFAEDLLRPVVDHGLQLRADLGRIPERSGPHAVAVGPRPERTFALLARPALLRIFDRGPRRDTRVPQRHQSLFGNLQQALFCVRVERRRVGDQRRFPRRQPSGPHRRSSRRQLLELLRRGDRGPNDTGRDSEQPGDCRTPVIGTRFGDPLGGLAEHPVDHPRDRTQLINNQGRRVTRKRARVEVGSNRVQRDASRIE